MQKRRAVMLVILDGWGWREDTADNAVRQARTPNFDRLWASCPHAFLHTSGGDVGLPDGQMGNSEVGASQHRRRPRRHAGPAADQRGRRQTADRRRPGAARPDRSASRGGGTCHLMGLVSPAACIRTRTTLRALAQHPARGGRAAAGARLHRRSRHPAAGRRWGVARWRGAARGRCRSPQSTAATTRWIATSAGPRQPRRTRRWSRTAPASTMRRRRSRDAYAHEVTDEFIVPGSHRRLSRHAGRRRHALLRLPRRPRAGDPGRASDPVFGGFPRRRSPNFVGAHRMALIQRSRRYLAHCFSAESLADVSAASSRTFSQPLAHGGRNRALRTSPLPEQRPGEHPSPSKDRIMVPSPKVRDLRPAGRSPARTSPTRRQRQSSTAASTTSSC